MPQYGVLKTDMLSACDAVRADVVEVDVMVRGEV